MQENIRLEGIWFLASNPEISIPGFLEYTAATGIELRLLGVFENGNVELPRPDLINGISSDGKKVTLYKCFCYESSFSTNSFETSKYSAQFMFIGELLRTTEDLRFEKIVCRLADFDEWLGAYGFNNITSDDETRRILIDYTRPEDLAFQVIDGINLDFRFNARYPIGKRRFSATITQTAEIDIWSDTGISSFEDLLDWLQKFIRLLTLAYFQRPLISQISLLTKKNMGDEEQRMLGMELYFKNAITLENYENKSRNLFLFSYNDIKANFLSILQKWYSIERQLEPTIGSFAETFLQKEQPVEFRFLSLIQALETLHRRTAEKTVLDNPEHNQKLAEIIAAVHDTHRDWLNEKLQFSHEPTLKRRLEELIAKIPDTVKKVLLKPSPTKFINQLRDNRNYYTHYDKKMESRSMTGPELVLLTERMKILLLCLLLKEILFSDDEICRCVLRKGTLLFNHVVKYEEAKDIFKDW